MTETYILYTYLGILLIGFTMSFITATFERLKLRKDLNEIKANILFVQAAINEGLLSPKGKDHDQ